MTRQRGLPFLLLIVWIPLWASSFHIPTKHARSNNTQRRRRTGLQQALQDDNSDASQGNKQKWLNAGLLLSSFSDGLKPNEQAQTFLMNGLVKTLWRDRMATIEQQVHESALSSPCCGPTDMESLNQMLDDTSTTFEQNGKSWQASLQSLILEHHQQKQQQQLLELRFLYIPTAMYAVRKDSNNSPGKQRQRARADGKKRRNEIVKLLNENLGEKVNVLTVTLELEEGSIKQPDGSEDPSKFPANGKEALEDWKPNLIYVQGGNTFWLYHCMEKGNWNELMASAVTGDDAAVYCGTSAGAILAGSSMETATWKGWDDPSVVPDRPTYEDWQGISGLSLAGDASVFPHMEDQWKSLVEDKQAQLDGTNIYCLRDDEVLCVDGSCKTVQLLTTTTCCENNTTTAL
jgi:peptidase E